MRYPSRPARRFWTGRWREDRPRWQQNRFRRPNTNMATPSFRSCLGCWKIHCPAAPKTGKTGKLVKWGSLKTFGEWPKQKKSRKKKRTSVSQFCRSSLLTKKTNKHQLPQGQVAAGDHVDGHTEATSYHQKDTTHLCRHHLTRISRSLHARYFWGSQGAKSWSLCGLLADFGPTLDIPRIT